MPNLGSSSYGKQINQLFFGSALIFVAIYGLRSMMFGSTSRILMIGALVIAVALALALDKHYWVLFPLLSQLGFKIPGLPFNTSEVAQLAIITLYFLRLAQHKERPYKASPYISLTYPFALWVFLIYCLNPPGLAIAGSSSIGARFYFQMALAFIAMHVISTWRFTEKDCKIFFLISLIGASCNTLRDVFIGQSARFESQIQNAVSAYEFLGAGFIYLWIFCRYNFHQILSSFPKMFTLAICTVAVIYSGKRKGLANLALYPILRTILAGKERALCFLGLCFGAFFLTFAMVGDGVAWNLPNSVKRSLSTINSDYGEGRKDSFRETVHIGAKELIAKHPFVGRKGFAINLRDISWIITREKGKTAFQTHIMSGGWHSLYWSLMADFGIPALILFSLFFFPALFFAFRFAMHHRNFPPFWTACIYYYAIELFIIFIWATGTGGTCSSSVSSWISIGLLIALYNSAKQGYITQNFVIS